MPFVPVMLLPRLRTPLSGCPCEENLALESLFETR